MFESKQKEQLNIAIHMYAVQKHSVSFNINN